MKWSPDWTSHHHNAEQKAFFSVKERKGKTSVQVLKLSQTFLQCGFPYTSQVTVYQHGRKYNLLSCCVVRWPEFLLRMALISFATENSFSFYWASNPVLIPLAETISQALTSEIEEVNFNQFNSIFYFFPEKVLKGWSSKYCPIKWLFPLFWGASLYMP